MMDFGLFPIEKNEFIESIYKKFKLLVLKNIFRIEN